MKFVGFWTRLLAFNTDLIFLLALFYALGSVIADNHSLYIGCLVTWILYESLFTATDWKGTPGKFLNKIVVIDGEGKKLTFLRILIRTISKTLSFSLIMSGFILIAFHPKCKGLHDLIAGSAVIHKDPV